jgi:hypothetical protein
LPGFGEVFLHQGATRCNGLTPSVHFSMRQAATAAPQRQSCIRYVSPAPIQRGGGRERAVLPLKGGGVVTGKSGDTVFERQ